MFEDEDTQETGFTAPSYTAPTARNPYSDQLGALAEKYLAQTEKQASDKQILLNQARDRILQRMAGPSDAQVAFQIAAALGRPTRTGSFSETLGGVAEVAGSALVERQKGREALEDLELKYNLAGMDAQTEGMKEKFGILGQLAKAGPKDKITETERMAMIANDPKAPDEVRAAAAARLNKLSYIKPEGPPSEVGRVVTDMGFKAGTPEYTAEVKRQIRVKESKGSGGGGSGLPSAGGLPSGVKFSNLPKAAKDIMLEGKFEYGTPEFEEELARRNKGGAVKLSPTEIKLKDETEGLISSSKEAILSLQRALDINDKAYEGGFADIKQTVGKFLPVVKDSEAQAASNELENILLTSTLSSLKAIFGGSPTEGENKLLQKVQGSLSQPKDVRKKIWQEAQAAAKRRYEANQNKLKQISSGAYSQIQKEPQGYADGGLVKGYEDGSKVKGDLTLANLGRAGLAGVTGNWGDEAIAKLRSIISDEDYEKLLQQERAELQRFGERYPMTALGSEIAGGVIPAVGAAMIPGGQMASAARLSSLASKIPQMMKGQIGRAAGAGATTGALAGSGAASEDRTGGAFGGAAMGAVAGPLLGKSVELAGRGGKAIMEQIKGSPMTVDQRATMKVLEAMNRNNMTPQDLRAQALVDAKMGVKPMLMDMSPAIKSMGEAVVTRAGTGRQVLGEPLERRLSEGRENVANRVTSALAKGQEYTDKEFDLVSNLRKNANDLYQQAYSVGEVRDPRILQVLEDDTFKKAYQEARGISAKEAANAKLRGEDPSQFELKPIYRVKDQEGNIERVDVPDVRTLDYIKRGIDAMIDKGFKGDSMSKAEAKALKDLRNTFVEVIDENVPEYATARSKFAGDMEVLDALRMGKDEFLSPKMAPKQAAQVVQGMSKAERDALRIGAAQNIIGKVLETPNQVNAAQRVIGSPNTRKRLETLFDDPNEYKVFEAALQRDAELFRNAQEAIRGSRTANKREALDDLKNRNIMDIMGEGVNLAMGSPSTMISRAMNFLSSHTGLGEKTSDELARMLRSGTPEEIEEVIQKLERSSKDFLEKQKRDETILTIPSGLAANVGIDSEKMDLEEPVQMNDEQRLRMILENTQGDDEERLKAILERL